MSRAILTWVTTLLLTTLSPTTSQSAAAEPVIEVRFVGASEKAMRVSVAPLDQRPDFQLKSLTTGATTVRKTSRGLEYFYASEVFQLNLDAQPLVIHFAQGIESIPQSIMVAGDGAHRHLAVQPHRWIDMAARDWYSGDSHIHINTGGPIKATIQDALLAGRAEGVNFLNLCVSNNLGDDLRDADRVTGQLEPESTDRVLLSYGEEMRSSIYGHMQFFGIKQVVLPQYTGFDNTPNHLDYPSNYTLAREAIAQGGVVTYGHPMLKNSPDAFGTKLTEPNGAARQLPIDAALGVVQAMDLMSYNCDKHLSSDLWYRLLNCGLKLAACVGTDALLDQSTDPLGGARVYAHVPDGLTMKGWLDALKAGRTFVTNGPMLDLQVNHQRPGSTIQLDKPTSVSLRIQLDSWVRVDVLDIIVNGQMLKQIQVPGRPAGEGAVPTDNSQQTLLVTELELPIAESCWIAVRASGPDHESLFDGPAWAHTSPVYVELAGQPIKVAEDRAYFVQWIEQMIRVVNTRNRYPSDEAREEVVALFRRAQEFYR